ncbi:MAG TPA: oligopeptidase B, partial [Flavobacteriales bacterium]|nr:oligopeptidase B [Flavobacteriales bacterium]
MMANPPKPAKKPVKLEKHGDIRIDNYYWLRDRENPEVLAYLKAENDYFDTQTAAYKPLENTLFEEMKARLKQEDESVPYFENGYFYQTKYLKGKEYPVYSRRKGNLEAPEEILFDVNQMAEKYSYYNLTGIDITPNNRYAVFGEDTTGRRQYILK